TAPFARKLRSHPQGQTGKVCLEGGASKTWRRSEMGISKMKDKLHARLWGAQQRWFTLKEQGWTKHDLKMQGIRERGDMFFATRGIIFTGATRLAYEHELRRFWDYADTVRG